MSFRDVTIESPDRKCDYGMCMDDFGDLKKRSVESSFSVRRRRLTFGAWQGLTAGATRSERGAAGKVVKERLCLSLFMSKNILTQRL